MRWSTIRLIARREIIELLRDRRTMLILIGLPLIIYPLFLGVGLFFALTTREHQSKIAVIGLEHLPPAKVTNRPEIPMPDALWLAAGVPDIGPDLLLARLAGVTYASWAWYQVAAAPPLIEGSNFSRDYCTNAAHQRTLIVQGYPDNTVAADLIASRVADVVITIPSSFNEQIQSGQQATIHIESRESDDRAKVALNRVRGILDQWRNQIKLVRFQQAGLPSDFDVPVRIADRWEAKDSLERAGLELRDVLGRMFPFLLIMWALAGALHPAIDLCAGEKERGTLETLLISPANRTEIVFGKLIATWAFSTGTAWWNLLWMGGGAVLASWFLPFTLMTISGFLVCAFFTMLLAALFSALSLALGIYARSSKEGQYYLLPIIMVVLPLCSLALSPGTEINLLNSFIPITGVTLYVQRILGIEPVDLATGLYIIPVLIGLSIWIALAIRWAIYQFNREDVLFRVSERPGLQVQLAQLLGWNRTPSVGR